MNKVTNVIRNKRRNSMKIKKKKKKWTRIKIILKLISWIILDRMTRKSPSYLLTSYGYNKPQIRPDSIFKCSILEKINFVSFSFSCFFFSFNHFIKFHWNIYFNFIFVNVKLRVFRCNWFRRAVSLRHFTVSTNIQKKTGD